ncbi:hypothetical protein LY622_22120 [Halomonas sp. M5N1S17]|uniref:hypothetical protein n=1 Tax=Halomonas alkalisoli TaxID=2907158 RepID=UPI001F269E7D|nr:hypothetical protein [Halomonas alkalisoli]MCE9666129.1 hypothetical protein [Halomonas alkalisoli]
MRLTNIKFEDMTEDVEFENPFYIIYADIYDGRKQIGRVEADIFRHFSNELEWHSDAEYSHVCTWRMDPETRLILSDDIDQDFIWSSEILLELEQHIDDKLNLPLLKVYAIDPEIYFEPDWHSGFGSFSVRVQRFNNSIEINGVDYEISQEGLHFTGDNDDSYREALDTIKSHYVFSDEKMESIKHEIDRQLASKLKDGYGIKKLEDALAYRSSTA